VTAICRVEDIPDRTGRGFTVTLDGEQRAILIVRTGRTVRAYVNECPHLGLNLDWEPDHFIDFEKRHILCGKHGALFRIDDGACVYGPCLGQSLEPVPLTVTDGAISLAA
jgi:nitrite reductase/ring-hydroxylating ferredoxin subunit